MGSHTSRGRSSRCGPSSTATVLARVLFDFNAATPVWSIVLGLWPALKAARQDPIEALRYE